MKNFRPKFLHAHAERAEPREILELDFHFQIREMAGFVFPISGSHTFAMKCAHPDFHFQIGETAAFVFPICSNAEAIVLQ